MTNPSTLLGTWELISFETRFDDGSTHLPYGPNAFGRILYLDNGTMSAHLMNPDAHQPSAISSDDPPYFSYCGTWRVKGDQAIHTVSAATFASWIGQEKTRTIGWQGDDLLLTARVIFDEKPGEGILRWRRLA